MRLAHRLGTSAAAVLLTAGCGTAAGSAPEVNGEWELVEFSQDGAVVPDPADGRATLTMADGELSGTSFCNSYSGSYRLDGDALSVSGLGGTEMGCAAELMDAEAAYLAALGAVDQAGNADGYLVLSGGDVSSGSAPCRRFPRATWRTPAGSWRRCSTARSPRRPPVCRRCWSWPTTAR